MACSAAAASASAVGAARRSVSFECTPGGSSTISTAPASTLSSERRSAIRGSSSSCACSAACRARVVSRQSRVERARTNARWRAPASAQFARRGRAAPRTWPRRRRSARAAPAARARASPPRCDRSSRAAPRPPSAARGTRAAATRARSARPAGRRCASSALARAPASTLPPDGSFVAPRCATLLVRGCARRAQRPQRKEKLCGFKKEKTKKKNEKKKNRRSNWKNVNRFRAFLIGLFQEKASDCGRNLRPVLAFCRNLRGSPCFHLFFFLSFFPPRRAGKLFDRAHQPQARVLALQWLLL